VPDANSFGVRKLACAFVAIPFCSTKAAASCCTPRLRNRFLNPCSLFPAVLDAVWSHITDGFNLVDLAVSDLENMSGRQIELAPIILPLGDSRHADDLQICKYLSKPSPHCSKILVGNSSKVT
jgi:hypothetical protein